MKKNGLGRGLDSLLINTDVSIEDINDDYNIDNLIRLSIDKIKRNKSQPRKVFDDEKIEELAESIKEHGVIQPVIVRKVGSNYELVAGERRWRAARKAGITEIPAVVRELTEEQNAFFAIIENMQRENLNPIEEAEGIETMVKSFNLSQEEVAKSIGKSRPYIANSLRLLKLPPVIRDFISEGKLSAGHSRCLITIEDEDKQIAIAKRAVREELSVREVERLSKEEKQRKRGKPAKRSAKGNDVIAVERDLKEIFGTKVIIDTTRKYQTIQIECYNNEELNRVIEMLKSL